MRLLLASLVGVATAQDGTQCNPEYLAAIQQICCVSGSLVRSLALSFVSVVVGRAVWVCRGRAHSRACLGLTITPCSADVDDCRRRGYMQRWHSDHV